MQGRYFYHQIFRKSIIAFGTVFNNIVVKRKKPGVDRPTGEDSLEIAIIGGNAMGGDNAVDDYMDGDGTGDVLTLDGIAYTFPLGGFTITTGDEVGADEQFSGACAYSSFTDLLGDCGTGELGGSGESGVSASYDFGNGLTFAAGIAGGGQSGAAAAVNAKVAMDEDLLEEIRADPRGVSPKFPGVGTHQREQRDLQD